MKRIIALTILFLSASCVYAQHCPSGSVPIQGGGTCATTAAGANLAITGVTQTGVLGTSSQVSTFPGTVVADIISAAKITGQTSFNQLNSVLYGQPSTTFTVEVVNSQYDAFPSLDQYGTCYEVGVYRDGTGHANNNGNIALKESVNCGITWGAQQILLTGTVNGNPNSSSAPNADYRDPRIKLFSATSGILVYFTAAWSTTGEVFAWAAPLTKTGATWAVGTPIAISPWAYNNAESGSVAVDSSNNVYIGIYGADSSGATYNGVKLVEINSTATSYSIIGTIANGVADSHNYSETSVAIDSGANWFALVRDDTTAGCDFATSANSGGTWGAKTFAFSSSSRCDLLHLSTGQWVTTFRSNTAPSGQVPYPTYNAYRVSLTPLSASNWGAGQETPGDVRTFSSALLNGTTSEYGSIVEVAPGLVLNLYSIQKAATDAGIYAQYYQPNGLGSLVGLGVFSYGDVMADGGDIYSIVNDNTTMHGLDVRNLGGGTVHFRAGEVSGDDGAVCMNVKHYTSGWYLDDTSRPGFCEYLDPTSSGYSLYWFTPGGNPRSPLVLLTCTNVSCTSSYLQPAYAAGTIGNPLTASGSWTPGPIADGAAVSYVLNVVGANPGDFCTASFSTFGASDALLGCQIQSPNSARIDLVNHNGTSWTPSPGTVYVNTWAHP